MGRGPPRLQETRPRFPSLALLWNSASLQARQAPRARRGPLRLKPHQQVPRGVGGERVGGHSLRTAKCLPRTMPTERPSTQSHQQQCPPSCIGKQGRIRRGRPAQGCLPGRSVEVAGHIPGPLCWLLCCSRFPLSPVNWLLRPHIYLLLITDPGEARSRTGLGPLLFKVPGTNVGAGEAGLPSPRCPSPPIPA